MYFKISKKEGNTWNRRPLDEKRLREASEVQRCMRIASTPASVAEEDIRRFLAAGYKTVDETQVVRIETERYFRYLMTLITDAGMEREQNSDHLTLTYFRWLSYSWHSFVKQGHGGS